MRMVICLQLPTVFWICGRIIFASYWIYMGLVGYAVFQCKEYHWTTKVREKTFYFSFFKMLSGLTRLTWKLRPWQIDINDSGSFLKWDFVVRSVESSGPTGRKLVAWENFRCPKQLATKLVKCQSVHTNALPHQENNASLALMIAVTSYINRKSWL
jgi:hypothetical protein